MGVGHARNNIKIIKRSAGIPLTSAVVQLNPTRPGFAFDVRTLLFEENARIEEFAGGVRDDYTRVYASSGKNNLEGISDASAEYFLNLGRQDIINRGDATYSWSSFLRLFDSSRRRSDADHQVLMRGPMLQEALRLGLLSSDKKRIRTWYTMTSEGRGVFNLLWRNPIVPIDLDAMQGKRRATPVREYNRAVASYAGTRALIGSSHGRTPGQINYSAGAKDYARALSFVDFTPDSSTVKNSKFDREGLGYDKLLKQLLEEISSKPLREIKPAMISVNNYDRALYLYGENAREGMLYRMDSSRELFYFRKKYGDGCQVLVPETAIGYADDKDFTHAIVRSKDRVVGIIRLTKQTLTPEQEALARRNLVHNSYADGPAFVNHESFSFALWQRRGKLPL
jgi:hypothetical protein